MPTAPGTLASMDKMLKELYPVNKLSDKMFGFPKEFQNLLAIGLTLRLDGLYCNCRPQQKCCFCQAKECKCDHGVFA